MTSEWASCHGFRHFRLVSAESLVKENHQRIDSTAPKWEAMLSMHRHICLSVYLHRAAILSAKSQGEVSPQEGDWDADKVAAVPMLPRRTNFH